MGLPKPEPMVDPWTRGLVWLKGGFLALLVVAAIGSYLMESDVRERLAEAHARQQAAAAQEAARDELARKVDLALQRSNDVKSRFEVAARERHFLLMALSRGTVR